jgi:hypothetical protein
MKYVFITFCWLFAQVLTGQNTCITVNLKGDYKVGVNKIYVENVGYGITDSMIFFKSPFKINVPQRPNSCYRLIFDNYKTNIFFTKNEEEITIDIDKTTYIHEFTGVYESSINGGIVNEMFYMSRDKVLELALIKLKTGNTGHPINTDDSIYQHLVGITQEHPFLGMTLLYDLKESMRSVDPSAKNLKKYINLVETLDENLRTLPMVKDVRKALDSLNRLTPGGSIHDFSLMNNRREAIGTFDKRGKFLLILFSLHGCEYVKEAETDLGKEYEALKQHNFEILEVNLTFGYYDFDNNFFKNIKGVYNYPWDNVYLFNDKNGRDIRRTYNAHSCPRTLLYSPDGILLEVNPSIEDIFKQLKLNKK